ncbi:uncharacterized protein LOC107795165 [Nicotiana tabacum]|uniref:uncharacterized protein LOC107795165 n=1 Tax=Nicotiana tabacum TaxID=4097 RepID=UPI003F4EB706
MTNNSETPVESVGTSSRTVFHPDDYTHPCHPLYVHPSDVLGASLVSVPFDGSGYSSWRRTILVALSVRNKFDFINGSSVNPPAESPLASVEYSELAKDIWSELEERYGKADGARLFELKKELAHISQGSLDIASYFNTIKQLWDDISSISVNHLSVCTCGGNNKVEEEQRVYQFLIGLNDTYLQVRSNIIMMKPLPSMNTVYNILLADEKQRQVSSASHFSNNSASFNAGYCKKQGHAIDKCYKLHGFPPNFKFTKGPGPRKAAAHVVVDHSGDVGIHSSTVGQNVGQPDSSQASAIPGLTKDQYSQLMMFLQQSHISTTSSPPTLMASANFAGILLPKNSSVRTCLLTKIDNVIWIIDSGASDHMTSDKSLLFYIETLYVPYLVSLPNGYKVKVHNVGSLALFPDLILHNVLYIPSFKFNLISVYKLVAKPGHMIQFINTGCTFQGPSLNKPVVLGRPDSGLHKLFQLPMVSNSLFSNSSLPSVSPSNDPTVVLSNNCSGVPGSSTSLSLSSAEVSDDVHMNKVNKDDVIWH